MCYSFLSSEPREIVHWISLILIQAITLYQYQALIIGLVAYLQKWVNAIRSHIAYSTYYTHKGLDASDEFEDLIPISSMSDALLVRSISQYRCLPCLCPCYFTHFPEILEFFELLKGVRARVLIPNSCIRSCLYRGCIQYYIVDHQVHCLHPVRLHLLVCRLCLYHMLQNSHNLVISV